MLDRDGNIEQTIHVFESTLLKRAEQEREFFKTEDINVLNAHDRKNVFSPQVWEKARRKFQ